MKKNSIINRVVLSLAARLAGARWKLPLAAACMAGVLAAQNVTAAPYASGITNNSGNIYFTLNESGGTVTVTYEDSSTNANFNGITTGLNVLKGTNSFALGAHTSYAISVYKAGNGTPSQISSDAGTFNTWNSPRGVDVNKNSKVGYLFGRTYVGNSATNATKAKGLYLLNADLTDSTGGKVFTNIYWSTNGSTSSPQRMRVAPDNDLLVCDFATITAALWKYSPDLTSSNLVLAGIGQTAAAAAGIHGDFFGTPLMSGSLAQSNWVLWTADSGMQVPTTNLAPNLVLGPGTSIGSFNCVYRYDIGAGPLPSTGWNNPPNYAYTLGLDGIGELRTEIDLGKDGKIITGFGRGNFSNPNIQVLTNNGSSVLWDSFESGGTIDRWNGSSTAAGSVGTFAGIRVSPDGQFLASVDANNGITVATLTNGIPDNSSIFAISNSPYTGNSRGMCWDAANNLLVISSSQALLRVFSLGITTTCVTSNDFTATNGSFYIIQPPVSATVVASTPQASQGGGTPVPGVFTISLNTSSNAVPVAVSFTRIGTATSYGAAVTNYIMNLGTNVNGVVIGTNSVTFPAGTNPVAGNWSVDVQIIPTPTPLIGPTLTANLKLLGGSTYVAGIPTAATVSILNTGPQYLFLTPISGATMTRAITGDYARFAITRWGDINAASYTVTNFNLGGTAIYPVDYTAGAQSFTGSLLADGTPGITISSGVVVFTNGVGNPVPRANLYATPNNVTVVINLTNSATGTNLTSSEGVAYTVSNNVVTLTELDNTIAPGEVVLWSNPLTNSLDSTNWTLAFAAKNFATNTTLPVVITSYINDSNSIAGGGTNDFNVTFGRAVSADGITPSPLMASNGWNNALKMTVNKANGYVAGVNLYPQGQTFRGNYALRFSMYLSIYSGAIGNPFAGTFPREFAAFGINHRGTNCNWRFAQPVAVGTGNSTTNSDGIWFAIDAGDNSITPADFDGFLPGGLPNVGVTGDAVSQNGRNLSGVFKNPPFTTMTTAGGQPVNKWVDVSLELTRQTNCILYVNRTAVMTPISIGTTTKPIRRARSCWAILIRIRMSAMARPSCITRIFVQSSCLLILPLIR